LAERVGRTPFYAYDRVLISARIAQLRQALPDEIHLHYAIKANPMPAVVQHLAASGNFGQVIRKNYPVLVANRVESSDDPETASVVGPLCTPLDLLADRMPLGHAREGDLIAVMQSGAYGLTASPTAFLGHPTAVEVLV
jgi:diaminopimelate decarboxylase